MQVQAMQRRIKVEEIELPFSPAFKVTGAPIQKARLLFEAPVEKTSNESLLVPCL